MSIEIIYWLMHFRASYFHFFIPSFIFLFVFPYFNRCSCTEENNFKCSFIGHAIYHLMKYTLLIEIFVVTYFLALIV